MRAKYIVRMLILALGATFALACQGDTCAALGTCPQKAPAPNGHQTGHGAGQPNPQRADPKARESGDVKVVMSCQWYGPFWVTFTPSIGGEPSSTKEKGPNQQGTGSYQETHTVAKGTAVAVTCRSMDRPAQPRDQKHVQCLLEYESGGPLPGARAYQDAVASTGVHCSGVA